MSSQRRSARINFVVLVLGLALLACPLAEAQVDPEPKDKTFAGRVESNVSTEDSHKLTVVSHGGDAKGREFDYSEESMATGGRTTKVKISGIAKGTWVVFAYDDAKVIQGEVKIIEGPQPKTQAIEGTVTDRNSDGNELTVTADGQVFVFDVTGAKIYVTGFGSATDVSVLPKGGTVEVVYNEGLLPSDTTLKRTAATVTLMPPRGIWLNNLIFGVQFSEDRGQFSETDAIMVFESDTLIKHRTRKVLKETKAEKRGLPCIGGEVDKNGETCEVERKRPWRLHTNFKIGLVSIPEETEVTDETDPRDPPDEDENLETFLASRKSLSMQLKVYMPWELQRGDDTLNIGWVVHAGISTITDRTDDEAAENADTVNHNYAGGFRFAHHRRTPKNVNPEVIRSVEVLYGYYEQFLDADPETNRDSNRERFIFNGALRVGKIPFYVGVQANLGEGKDDIRLTGAFRLDVSKLATLVGR